MHQAVKLFGYQQVESGMSMRTKVVLDIECYRNYFLVAVKSLTNNKVVTFEQSDWSDFDSNALGSLLTKYTIVTFNGNRYDILMLKAAMSGFDSAKLKVISDDIIVNNLRPWEIEEKYNLSQCKFIDSIDLIEVSPGIASLKIYGGRLHSQRMQDLPIEPNALIKQEERDLLGSYCINDLDITIDLYNRLSSQIDLREQMSKEYGLDLRSKSDAQIAEAVIKKQIETIKGVRVYKPVLPMSYRFNYVPPAFIKFNNPDLIQALNTFKSKPFTLNEKGDVAEPKEVGKLKIKIGSTIYQLGIGGIHSCEKKVHYIADKDYVLIDRDVTSYYPNIILSQKLYPKHIGPEFLAVYKSLVEKRVKAKVEGNKIVNESLKVTINGSFGKFGSKWSALYSPDLLIQTTVTGQLALLMLIERVECAGIQVVSANTDGIVIYCHKRNQEVLNNIIATWEQETGFTTEETQYCGLYSRDINNYLALKSDGSIKAKGTYAEANLSKTPTTQICTTAVIDYLQLGIPIESTINSCIDIKQFISVRSVTGGAVKGDKYLGKAVRWYYASGETGAINYKSNGNRVAMTDGAKPLMVLPSQLPIDINYKWYIDRSNSILADLGIK
jgi:DNA polymerase elongation subunit (family B)